MCEKIIAFFLCLVAFVGARYNFRQETVPRYIENNGTCSVELIGYEVENKMVEAALSLKCETGFSGALVEIRYRQDGFLLLSCGTDGKGLNCSFYVGDTVRILLDGTDSSTDETVKLYFERKDGFLGGGVFEIVNVEVCQFYAEGEICYPDVDVISKDFKTNKIGDDDAFEAVSFVKSILHRNEQGKIEIRLQGFVSDRFFAAGFKVFAIELDGAESECFEVVGITRGGTFEKRICFDLQGNISIVVTPIAYKRDGMTDGNKKVLVFND